MAMWVPKRRVCRLLTSPCSQRVRHRYISFSVLITQVAENRKYVGGDVTIKVIGLMGEQRETITFSQDNAVVGYPLKFRFRYFQDLIGQLKLPDGFRPERVSIDVRQRNKPPISADFEWLVQQA